MSAVRRVVIIGGVAGGMSAATRMRRNDESAEILVLERGPEVSYANCGLPYFVGGIIPDRAALLLQTPESLHSRFRLDVRALHEAVAIDRAAKTVRVRDLQSGAEIDEPFDALVLAVGAAHEPADLGGIPTHSLRTVADAVAVDELLRATPAPASAVVLGGGFIGLEATENLVHRDAGVHLVSRSPLPFAPLDPEMVAPIVARLRERGVVLHLGRTVVGSGAGELVLDDGTRLPADLVVDATGVHPETALAAAAGLALGPTGGIAVDAQQRTSDPAIFAVGDGVEKADALTGAATLVTMAGLANRQGRAIADAIAGAPHDSSPALGTSVIGVFGLTAATVGWSEKRLIAAGIPHLIVHAHPGSHAGYYPGAAPLAMKLLLSPADARILGAQVVGEDGVDKRIDVIATAMHAGLRATELAELELAYAPQYGSAKDAVNIIGYVARNLLDGSSPTVQWHELAAARDSGAALLDVRSPAEHAAASIPGAVNIPLDDLRDRFDELPAGPLIVHCAVGQRGHYATRLLRQLGRDARNLDGGFRTWESGVGSFRA